MERYYVHGNPYALFTNNVVTEVIYMQDYSAEEIEETLKNYSYEEVVRANDIGEEILIGYMKLDGEIVRPKPAPSWSYNKELKLWEAPIPAPDYCANWDEETFSWLACPQCEPEKQENNLYQLEENINAN